MNDQSTLLGQACAFDLGGVLIAWDPRHAYSKIIHDRDRLDFFLGEVCGAEWLSRLNAGEDFASLEREAVMAHPEFGAEIHEYRTLWPRMITECNDEVMGLAWQMKQAGIGIYLFTNHPREVFANTLERVPALLEFDGLFVSGVEHRAKPSPDAYRRFVDRFGASKNWLLIDDTLENCVSAKNMGWDAIWYANATGLRVELADRGIGT